MRRKECFPFGEIAMMRYLDFPAHEANGGCE